MYRFLVSSRARPARHGEGRFGASLGHCHGEWGRREAPLSTSEYTNVVVSEANARQVHGIAGSHASSR